MNECFENLYTMITGRGRPMAQHTGNSSGSSGSSSSFVPVAGEERLMVRVYTHTVHYLLLYTNTIYCIWFT